MGFLKVIPEHGADEWNCLSSREIATEPLRVRKRANSQMPDQYLIPNLLHKLDRADCSTRPPTVTATPLAQVSRTNQTPSKQENVRYSFPLRHRSESLLSKMQRPGGSDYVRKLAQSEPSAQIDSLRPFKSLQNPCPSSAAVFVDSTFGYLADKNSNPNIETDRSNGINAMNSIYSKWAQNFDTESKSTSGVQSSIVSARARISREGLKKAVRPEDHSLKNSIRSKSGTKYNFIRRVMSGINHRGDNAHLLRRTAGETMPASHYKAVLPEFSDLGDGSAFIRNPPSFETDDHCVSDFEGAIPTFPAPPTRSSHKSSTTSGSSGLPCASVKRPSYFGKPENESMMGARVVLTPEYETLSCGPDKAMFVAIDVAGILNSTRSKPDDCSRQTGLDVAVAIDNSLFTSPSALMAGCEITRFIATILNGRTDRLAVVCTSIYSSHGSRSTTVWPLTPIKTRKLKTVLDGLTCSNERPTDEMWTYTVNRAIELLSKSDTVKMEHEMVENRFAHVVLLTAHTACLSPGLLEHDKIQFHLICPAIVPRNDEDLPTLRGWKLGSMSTKEPRAVTFVQDTDPLSLLNKIKNLIEHARSGKLFGGLTDVVLDIRPGLNCSIEGVIGNTNWPALRPGELKTVIVKLRFRGSKTEGFSLHPDTSHSGSSTSNSDFINEIDRMLGVSPVKFLSATLTYQHSLLPPGTRCTVATECWVNREFASAEFRQIQYQPRTDSFKSHVALVHQRLAFLLATHDLPGKAIFSLRKEFGEGGLRSSCASYVSLIINELKYQARINERVEIEKSPRRMFSSGSEENPESPLEYFGQGLFDFETYKPRTPNNGRNGSRNSSKEDIQLTSISSRTENRNRIQRPQYLVLEPDEKGMIFADMKKASKREQVLDTQKYRKPKCKPQTYHGRRSFSSNLESEWQKRIRDLIIRDNKGKGSGPFRAITAFGESVGRGLGGLGMD